MPTPAIQRMFLSMDRRDLPASSKSTAEHSANKMMQLRMRIAHLLLLQPSTLPLPLVVTHIVATYSLKFSTTEHCLHYCAQYGKRRSPKNSNSTSSPPGWIISISEQAGTQNGFFAALYNTWYLTPLLWNRKKNLALASVADNRSLWEDKWVNNLTRPGVKCRSRPWA